MEFEKQEWIEKEQEQGISSEGAEDQFDTATDLPDDWATLREENTPLPNEEEGMDGTEQASETEEKPKRKSRKKKEESSTISIGENGELSGEERPDASVSDEFFTAEEDDQEAFSADEELSEETVEEPGAFSEDTEPGELTEERETDTSIDTDPGRERRRLTRRKTVVLDSSGNVVRERADSSLHDISILTAARNARRILTTTVDAVETDGNMLPRVVVFVGTVKLMIPFSEMGFDLDPQTVTPREARLLIHSMLGAKIDYMVRGVDIEERLAVGSRRDAMLVRQATILNARGVNRDYRITEGMRVTARITNVSQYTVRVEVYGFESWVPIGDISNLWVKDIREVIQVGEERPVEITSLTRDEDGKVTSMKVSIRAAEDIPHLEVRVGNTYTGYITSFSETAYFVRVVGIPVEIRCPARSNHVMELLNIGDMVKFYVRGIYDDVPTGAILKVIKKNSTPIF
ncbi:hypothetical protein B5F11_09550 [Anaerotruncus colihominis]|uniref:S1 motif domain-containing protein n=1 Tax=Anaerotruncus colihominis TaxID=169435 RepID=A0A1Y4MKR7_9FIRM|nr:S1 RNA-binding domain-containing protein [Anaerotruncus colihominis]OUP69323.1 hypothetical protein B5F11_09550 [Anaerotruncus colihominis]